MNDYVFSRSLGTFLRLATARMQKSFGCTLLLEGPPGAGKTSFARAFADQIGGKLFYYSGSPDKERDLLYEIDVNGVLTRENAWTKGPAWEAFALSIEGGYAVLLIDEVDKTNPGFDSFLLRLLEEWTFRSPDGKEIIADATKIAVILTSNGRRKLRPEVLRRTQRVQVPMPDNGRLEQIVRQIAGIPIPQSFLNLVVRIGDAVHKKDSECGPSPKEMALCCVDLLNLRAGDEIDNELWREVAASWLTKMGGPKFIDTATGFKWTQALINESQHKS